MIQHAASYEKQRERQRRRAALTSVSGREIGDIPAVENAARKAKCKKSFKSFCEIYFPETFNLEWSSDHLKVMKQINKVVTRGGLFSLAMPRGSGKTSLCEIAVLWAALYGFQTFTMMIAADQPNASDSLDSIKSELENNELLMADFPEVCYPISCLEGISQRATGQLHKNTRTLISWTSNEIVFPLIKGSKASAVIIRVVGITGSIRGAKFKRPDGATVRPSLVLVDDPQTDESADSPSQCAARERILTGAILGLAGPGEKIAVLMPVTIIRQDDLADRMLDRERHPEWQGFKTRMIDKFPTNEDLWETYAEIRKESLKKGNDGVEGTAFYKKNRKAMDKGARVSWKARFNADEISAIQHAMNLKIDKGPAFYAEYQNEPESDIEDNTADLTEDQIIHKINGHARDLVPEHCQHITAMIDVQKNALFYTVCAWSTDFSGAVIDYGIYPDQGKRHFQLRNIKKTLATAAASGAGLEGQIYAGLEKLCEKILAREYKRDDGALMRVGRCMVDAAWGTSTKTVRQFCRNSPHSSILIPSFGRGVTASNLPITESTKKRGDLDGLNWRIPAKVGQRHLLYDTNFWKSFLYSRLAVPTGDRGALSLFGRDPETHRPLASHIKAEYSVRTEGRGRSVDEWKIRPQRPDNHWFDTLVGCCVAANVLGVQLDEAQVQQPRKRKRRKLSEMQKR
jgi:hypothetical protein